MPKIVENKKQVRFFFSYFLNIRAFALLYSAGIIADILMVHGMWVLQDSNRFELNVLNLLLAVFLGPVCYFCVKTIYQDFQGLFTENKEISYLFNNEADFRRYKQENLKMLTSKRERYFIIGLIAVLIPLYILEDTLTGFTSRIFSTQFPLPAIEYSYVIIFWIVFGAILLSVFWMIGAVVRSFLNLPKEKSFLHITHSISELQESFQKSKQGGLVRARMGLLDLSFRRFKASLSPYVNFALSASLKIAFIGMFFSIPALFFFLVTRQFIPIWYIGCIAISLLSVIVFVIGQYGSWKLWVGSKKDVQRLLDRVCAEKTLECSDLYLPNSVRNPKEIREIERDVDLIRKLNYDLNQLTTITFTSSSIFKIVSANFLAFAPLIIEQVIILYLLK